MSTKLWCVRGGVRGVYTHHFLAGGYAAIGWAFLSQDLSTVDSLDELKSLYREHQPVDEGNAVIGQNAGQIWRFLREIQPGDWIITPAAEREQLRYGQVETTPYYFEPKAADGCPYAHRRRIKWAKRILSRSDLSIPFQSSLRAMPTVFSLTHLDEFLAVTGRGDQVLHRTAKETYDAVDIVLRHILELSPKEFEELVGHLLWALGFEGTEVVGKSGDHGVDATGELDVASLARVKLYVQAKRYDTHRKVKTGEIYKLRGAIPSGGQGAIVTTGRYRKDAHEVANEAGFPRIGLINGPQLVDLLVLHWDKIPQDFQERLGLKPGLVPV